MSDENVEMDLEARTEVVPEPVVDHALERRKRLAKELESSSAMEHRSFAASNLELRAQDDGTLKFTGWASVTETPYKVGPFLERVEKGAFRRSLGQNPDVIFLLNHGFAGELPLARTTSGTLTLTEDVRGLYVEAILDPTDPDVQRIQPKIERGDLTEMSFAFQIPKGQQSWNEDHTVRTIRSCELHRGDVSLVNNAANQAAIGGLSIRSDDGELEFRSGKTISTQNEAKIKDTITQLSELLSKPDEPEVDEPGPINEVDMVPRSYIETAKAHRAARRLS